jgi:hypothetical protein
MRWLGLFFLAVLLCAFLAGVMILVNYLPNGTLSYAQYEGNTTLMPKTGAAQFYPHMRYADSQITYYIEDACSAEKIVTIEKALHIISNDTMLTFQRVDSDGQITYLCSLPAPSPEQEGHFVAGEGGPTKIINTTIFSLILTGEAALYRDEKCSTPNIALHETFHALGFDHVNDQTDIMYPVTDCHKEIKPALIDAINQIYSYPSEPNLEIEYVSANQTGRYLNFNITIGNRGLRNSEKSHLTLYVDSKEIKSFDLSEINVGTKKLLNVQNLFLGSEASILKFTVTPDDGQHDLFNKDDSAEITLVSNQNNL